MRVEPVLSDDITRLQLLVNQHLAAVVPGWAVSAAHLARVLVRDEAQVITEPWVVARQTLCVRDGMRILAAAHLLRFADRDDVSASFRGLGEISWVLGWPDADAALAAVLAAARARFADWRVRREAGWGDGLPADPFCGVPECWPHIAAALVAAGYHAAPGHEEALFGGPLSQIPAPAGPPLVGLSLGRSVGQWGTRFAARLDGEELGYADSATDLTQGGAVPGPAGWAELGELWVREAWRDRGVGTWLVRHLAAWHRLGGATRIVLSVAADDEAAGAGRFYQRFGWQPFTRSRRLWLPAERGAGGAALPARPGS